ncbi:ATP-binding protein [Sediminivirga luteola]|nr:ATP-binding protein [Sediminivirga luteola]
MTMTTTGTTMTMTTTMTTTERRHRRPRFSVTQRITTGVLLLTAIGLGAVGLLLYVLESANLDNRIDQELSQEIVEFRGFAENGVDPETGRPFESADRLLRVFLERNQPGTAETFFAFTMEGPVLYQGVADPRLSETREFVALVEGLMDRGGRTSTQIGDATYRFVVLPLHEGSDRGAFVAVHNVTEHRQSLNELLRTYTIAATMATLIVALLSSLIARRLLQPVHELRTAAQSITAGELDRRLEASGSDDLAELIRTFNDMLDRLESAFETQRQFLDDAGHELRTPLTVLRGHLEVLDPADVNDVEETRALLLDEIGRMSRLVEDLLVLAKTRRPDFVRAEPVEVSVLLKDVFAKASALGPRDWDIRVPPPVTIQADPQRLTQAMLQLADDAVRYTEEGTSIVLGADAGPDAVDLWVSDQGPGVPPDKREVIFQRFGRASQDDQGFGLGLTIVSAIAQAHGGQVLLDDTVTGATFRLRLPRGEQGEQ